MNFRRLKGERWGGAISSIRCEKNFKKLAEATFSADQAMSIDLVSTLFAKIF